MESDYSDDESFDTYDRESLAAEYYFYSPSFFKYLRLRYGDVDYNHYKQVTILYNPYYTYALYNRRKLPFELLNLILN